MIEAFCPAFIYKPWNKQIIADSLLQHPQRQEADLCKLMFYKLLIGD
jgi:hypothetical protein